MFNETELLLIQQEKTVQKEYEELPSFDPAWYKEEEEAGCFSPCSIVNTNETRALVHFVFDERGHLVEERLLKAMALLEKNLYPIGTGGEELQRRRQKLSSSLFFLLKNNHARQLIHRIGRPYGNKIAETAIRSTLLLEENAALSEVDTRKAVVAALLGTLRQSLGSCFATAPAILVHEHQPDVFLENIEEMFSTSRLKKVMGGQEYVVPQNMGWGEGDLRKTLHISLQKEATSQPFWLSKTLLKGLFSCGLIDKLPETHEQAFSLFIPTIEFLGAQKGAHIAFKDLLLSFLLCRSNLTQSDYDQFLLRTEQPLFHPEIDTRSTRDDTAGPFARKMKLCTTVRAEYDRLILSLTSATDIALLKMWEYTLASFAEVKLGMCRNNFYISLGVNWNDEGGIGNVLYEAAKQRVEEANQLVEESQREYDALNVEMTLLEQRLRSASTEKELEWLKVEHQSRQVEQYNLRQRCQDAVDRANTIAHLHELLLEQYDILLKEYFQEIYDPDLHEVQTGPYDDSPAGFRLLYKHGRSNSALWTLIRSLDEWKDAIASFFSVTEQELLLLPELKYVEDDVRQIISHLVQHIRSDYFVETALMRYAAAYQVPCPKAPLQHLDQVQKKPWVYTSGGSMNSLVESYFALAKPPEEQGRWVENETELFAYIIDTVRVAQKRLSAPLPRNMLMHSPTHAFLLLPYHPSFKDSWQSDSYSYTWIKKNVEDPARSFYSSYAFNPETLDAINESIARFLDPTDWQYLVKELSSLPPFLRSFEYVKEITHLFQIEAYLRPYADKLAFFDWDGFFFSHLPYLSKDQIEPIFSKVVQHVLGIKNGARFLQKNILSKRLYSKQEWLILLQTALISYTKDRASSRNLLIEALDVISSLISTAPKAVIFADTNWMKEYFAFAISPVTLSITLWTASELATRATPMTTWTPWLNGSRKDRTWGLLINPMDYTMKKTFSVFQEPKSEIRYFG